MQVCESTKITLDKNVVDFQVTIRLCPQSTEGVHKVDCSLFIHLLLYLLAGHLPNV